MLESVWRNSDRHISYTWRHKNDVPPYTGLCIYNNSGANQALSVQYLFLSGLMIFAAVLKNTGSSDSSYTCRCTCISVVNKIPLLLFKLHTFVTLLDFCPVRSGKLTSTFH